MNHWIFVVTEHETNGETLTPDEIFRQRMQDHFWGIGAKTPNRKALSKGDKVVYYLGSPWKAFAGTSSLASSCFELSESQRKNYSHGKLFYIAQYGVLLEEVEVWRTPKPAEELIAGLKFIEKRG